MGIHTGTPESPRRLCRIKRPLGRPHLRHGPYLNTQAGTALKATLVACSHHQVRAMINAKHRCDEAPNQSAGTWLSPHRCPHLQFAPARWPSFLFPLDVAERRPDFIEFRIDKSSTDVLNQNRKDMILARC